MQSTKKEELETLEGESIRTRDNESKLQPPRPAPWNNQFIPTRFAAEPRRNVHDSVTPSILCVKCGAIRTWMQMNITMRYNPKHTFNDHYTGTELEESCTRGCHLCTLIWASFTQPGSEGGIYVLDRELLRASAKITVIFKELPESNWNRAHYVLRSFAEVESESAETKSHGSFLLHMGVHRGVDNSVDITVYKMSGGLERGTVIESASCAIYTDSDSSWRLVQGWIKTCVSSHQRCSQARLSTYSRPTMLLDVRPTIGPWNLRLVERENLAKVGEYAALSYSWGGQSGFKLSTATLEKLKCGIFPSVLS